MSAQHPDRRRSFIACAGFVRCIWLLSGPLALSVRSAMARGEALPRTRERYSDLPSMTVGLMSVNLATSARTSAIAGLARAAFTASDEANWK